VKPQTSQTWNRYKLFTAASDDDDDDDDDDSDNSGDSGVNGIVGEEEQEDVWRLAYWNADGVRGRKQELEHFLGQHGVDICLLTEAHLRSGVVFPMGNYVCHHTDRLTAGGGTAIMVRRGIDRHAVPIQGLELMGPLPSR
jgi:hypothetical protein